jgi:hypothetical protein
VGEKRARTLAFRVLVLLVVASICAFLAAKPAHADTTFTVDTSDDPDLTTTPTADECTEATANDCSLRGAINVANNTSGVDTINFNIPEDPADPADDLKTILVDGTDDPASSANLPEITEAVTINGYSQPWARPNTNADLVQGTNANLLIVLNGGSLGTSGIRLRIEASDDVVVKGLAINCFTTGIFIPSGGSRAVIEGNFIGAHPGVCTTHNGVNIFGSDNTIGAESPPRATSSPAT